MNTASVSRYQVYLTPPQVDDITAEADRCGLRFSEIVRRAIDTWRQMRREGR